jgi:multidrug transporter EmrE-like cation transporter
MNYVLLIISAILASGGQIFLKKSALTSSIVNQNYLQYFSSLILNLNSWFAVLAYGMSFFLYMIALQKIDLSIARSFNALSYVLIIVFSFIFFKDSISFIKIIGIIFITFGIFIISFTK